MRSWEQLKPKTQISSQPFHTLNPKRCAQGLKSFWMPSLAPESKVMLDKPDLATYCPATGKKLRLKDLTPVKLTRVREGEDGRYCDPVTGDTLTNSNKLVLLKPTGIPPPHLRLSFQKRRPMGAVRV